MDHYAPPKSPAHSATAALNALDDTDLYIATLPGQLLKVLGGAMIITGVVTMFMGLRLLLVTEGARSSILVAVHVLAGLPYFPLAWGATGGKPWCLVVACVLAPVVALLSVFALLTLSIAGLAGLLLAVLVVVLAVMNFSPVRRIQAARFEMRRRAALFL
jgi:hypothetical protein